MMKNHTLFLFVSLVLFVAKADAQSNHVLMSIDEALASYDPLESITRAQKDELLWVARACWVEAEFNKHDCIATTWIAKKRAPILGVSWPKAMKMYSAIMKKTARARDARTFPWGDIKNKDETFNKQWRELRELVVYIYREAYNDPCPRAAHWGGPMDPAKPGMMRVRCTLDVSNIFYSISKKQETIATK